MLSYEQALEIVKRRLAPRQTELVPLSKSVGRVLAQTIAADRDFPPFDRSAMDGFAVRSADVVEAPTELEVIGEIPAGVWPTGEVGARQTMRIMTGAPLPPGADAVQMVENSEPLDDGRRVRLTAAVSRPYQNVCRQGEDTRRGDTVARAGAFIRPGLVGALGALGYGAVPVYRRPRVAVWSTGDELVEVTETPKPQQIRDSNRYMIGAYVEQAGGEVLVSARIADDPRALRETLAAAEGADLWLLSGGVSMGQYDFVESALREVGVEIGFHKVRIRPGKPLLFGTRGELLVFGLPGNPVSSAVMMQLFVAPTLLGLQGATAIDPLIVPLRCMDELPPCGSRETYLPAIWVREGAETVVRPVRYNGSGDLLGFSQGSCLIRLAAQSPAVRVGDWVDVWMEPASVRG
ncbi:MAG: molybdopterin molybdotransferase MoeA [Myxococcales bacterium]|nr:molybdopterin molybdotransferase MoeA [Myxococcales bacterium]